MRCLLEYNFANLQNKSKVYVNNSPHLQFGFLFVLLSIFAYVQRSDGDGRLQVTEMDTSDRVSAVPVWSSLDFSKKPRRSTLVSLSPRLSRGAGPNLTVDIQHSFELPLHFEWGLRGAEASAWFSRVKTKRLLKILWRSHDLCKDLDPTCVAYSFQGLDPTHTKKENSGFSPVFLTGSLFSNNMQIDGTFY